MRTLTHQLEQAGRVTELRGVTPSGEPIPLVTPTTEEALIELVRRAAKDELRVLPIGRGSKLACTRPTTGIDFAVTTREISGIVAHEPEDGTITALAGTTWAELAERARSGGHHLSPAVPHAADATLGGVIAAGQSGMDRDRFGPLRSQLLGVRALLADGSVTKSGGRLVKNVTGFDLHRLYCGSRGSLCILLEASLRLHTAPQAERHLILETGGVHEALHIASELRETRLEPWLLAVDAETTRGPAHLHLELAGRDAVVADELAALPGVWKRAELHAGDAARAMHAHYADGEADPSAHAALRLALRPSRLADVWDRCQDLLTPSSPLRFIRMLPGLASIELTLNAASPTPLVELTRALRVRLASSRARVTLVGGRTAMQLVDPFDDVGPALPWMRELKQRFDPNGLFAAGRGPGGL